MPTDPALKPETVPLVADYWDIPEIATLLRWVTHLNIGATIGLALWFVVSVWDGESLLSALFGASATGASPCQCELMLTPIPQGPRHIAQIGDTLTSAH